MIMKRLSPYLLALALVIPGIAGAQGNSHAKLAIADHWLTQATLTSALGLSDADWDRVKDAYADVNTVLAAATSKKNEHSNKFKTKKHTKDMTEGERNEQVAELQAIRTDYDARQANLTSKLNTLRALLSADQQALFDALEKPRLAPTTPPPGPEVIPPTPGRKPRTPVPPSKPPV